MPDYSRHRLLNWEWYHQYRSRMGVDNCDRYINSVYRMLSAMKPGSFFIIEKNVRPENIDLFIKVCCMYILESTGAYEFSNDYSIIRHK